jgi:hypothetical protein
MVVGWSKYDYWKTPIYFSNRISCRYLTVFRDIQQSEGRPGIPTEWNGEKDRTRAEVINISPFTISNNK